VNLGQGIGLILTGLFLILFGGAGYDACASQLPIEGSSPSCGGILVFLGIGVLLVIAGAVALAVTYGRQGRFVQQVPDPSLPPPVFQPVVVQQAVVGGRVEIRCAYCGTLYDATARSCPSCGAPASGA
jgi:hypothetical protein